MSQASEIPVIARYTFKPDRVEEFSAEGTQIVEMALETVEEVQEFAEEFRDALLDVTVLVNGQVISLSDFATESDR
jgi:hypothetical protein